MLFSKHLFLSNRTLGNVFHERQDELKTRIELFRDNPKWYSNRGIPYTLGLLLFGAPGTGKTSAIKAIANDLNRHIININLSKIQTKTELKSLFYDDQFMIKEDPNSKKTNTYIIPINKRVYVIEDIDAVEDSVVTKKG